MVWRTGRLTWGSSGALDAAGAEDGGVFRSRRNMQELCKAKKKEHFTTGHRFTSMPCSCTVAVAELEVEHAVEFE